jgi:hypothetical protein
VFEPSTEVIRKGKAGKGKMVRLQDNFAPESS